MPTFEEGHAESLTNLEKDLIFAKNTGEQISGYLCFFELGKVIDPKLVFHKNSHCRIYHLHELAGISGCIKGKIDHYIGIGGVFAHLVA